MPVYLEHISQPSEQDWIDLEKIYADAPQEWLSNADDIKASLQPLIDQQTWIIGGRFNSRLLGAMQASKEENSVTLQHLSVRNVTKNRGVAHQLMHHVNSWADENSYTLIAKGVPAALANSLIKRGFSEQDGHFIRLPE